LTDILASKRPVGVEQQTPFVLSRVFCRRGFIETAKIVSRRSSQAEFVTDKIFENGARIAADRTMGFIGNHKVEVSGRKNVLVFIVEQERLHGTDDDFRVSPIVPILFEDNGLVVVCEQSREGLLGLVFKFQPIDEEKNSSRVARLKEYR
jgi:hypothetical protein